MKGGSKLREDCDESGEQERSSVMDLVSALIVRSDYQTPLSHGDRIIASIMAAN